MNLTRLGSAGALVYGLNPLVGLVAGGLIGAATAAFATKYNVTISEIGKGKGGRIIYRMVLRPA